jgi:hypothetical protein
MSVRLNEIMAGVLAHAPHAVVFEESDGNVSIALNMTLNSEGLLESMPDEVDDEG